MNIYTPYTYLIGWSEHQKYYYGVRFAIGCNPSDLWVKYYTSSKHVKTFRETYGEPDLIQIRKTFSCAEKAKIWESTVLQKMGVKDRLDFLNITDTNNIVSKAMSDGLIAHWAALNPEQRKIRSKNAIAAMQAAAKSPAARKKMSDRAKKRMAALTDTEMRHQLRGVRSYHQKLSKEEKSVIGRKLAATRTTSTCPYCGKTGATGNMNRWHNYNCKFKN